ncbi:MAG: acylphosphatase [Desulfomonile tiedjei]|uniref:Acylphosphatase n=1 Tax=Desulfomonile tiedjei TaxID=2358 RepID=A0A9D6Z1S6_9BACT|nr:acylphosphatase [Desulfomonile tiedjei]
MGVIRRRVVISGLVQGVSFRYHTRSKARQLGALGWVRNLPDGRVEAVFEGDENEVSAMIDWCSKGPAYSRVESLKIYEEPPTGDFMDFEITYTGGTHWSQG